MLQVEGRQNWIPENKGAGWRFRTVGTSAQHTKKKQDLVVEHRGYAQKQLDAKRIILRRLTKSNTQGQIVTARVRDTAGKQLGSGDGEEEESPVGQETRRAAVRLSLLLRVIFFFWSTYITDGCSDLRLRLMRSDRLTHTRVKRHRDPVTSSKHWSHQWPDTATRSQEDQMWRRKKEKNVCCLSPLKSFHLRVSHDVQHEKL